MTYTDRVREHLADCIYPALARADVFAAELDMHPQTLRRALRNEGTSWLEIRAKEMIARVIELRREGVSERGIADALGYAEMQSYQRFLSAWTRARAAA